MSRLTGFIAGFMLLPWILGQIVLMSILSDWLGLENKHVAPGFFAFVAVAILFGVAAWIWDHP